MQETEGRLADSAAGRIFALDEAAAREAAGELAEAVESHGLPTVLADVGADGKCSITSHHHYRTI